VQCSTGVTVLDDATSWSEALRRADVALYEAKTGRRGVPGSSRVTAGPHGS
jgi:GGDEF domain-containing protein